MATRKKKVQADAPDEAATESVASVRSKPKVHLGDLVHIVDPDLGIVGGLFEVMEINEEGEQEGVIAAPTTGIAHHQVRVHPDKITRIYRGVS